MFSKFETLALRNIVRDLWLWFAAAILAVSASAPFILQGTASAATLTARSVTITNSAPSATGVSYDFDFTFPSTGVAQSIVLSFCTTPLGTCTLPTGMSVDPAATSISAQTFTQGTAFAEVSADSGACTDADQGTSSTQYCANRTEGGTEAADAKSITIAGVTNPSIPSGNNTTVYVRAVIYSTNAFGTVLHDGTVAASIVNQLTVTGRVQERLVFCVFAEEDTDTLPTDCADTEAGESSNVDLGVIDNSGIAQSPVDNSPPTSLGNDRFGAAMINTNAASGVTMSYYATQAGSGTNELRAFRVAGATCNVSGTSLTDQCFISADDSTGETFTAGTERFGLQIPCVNQTQGTTSNLGENGSGVSTSGSGSGGSFNTVYSNTDDTINADSGDDCENGDAGVKFGWRDSGTAQPLISSTTVVDDEIVKMNFGATANATTPTGTYTVASTYIATPVF